MLTIMTHEGRDKGKGESSFIGYYPNYFSSEFCNQAYQYCNRQNEYREGTSSFGKSIPRLQKWYQTEGHYFCPSWRGRYKRWEAFPYDNELHAIQERVNLETTSLLEGIKNVNRPIFNSCLINCYRDENDSIKLHYDNKEVFGLEPTIAIVSLGETRDIYFHRSVRSDCDENPSIKLDKKNKHLNCKISLQAGSLLIMAGATQKYYLHEIPKSKEMLGMRYSLTFRSYYH